jgi:deoxyadenosine/deoxycytidine kinase
MFILEGNIGAGKSTFLRLIKKKLPSLSINLEPIDTWQKDIYGQSLLANFYNDPKRWAYTFETTTMLSRVHEHLKDQQQSQHDILVVERSLYSGYHCFAYNSYQQGFLSEVEWMLYQQWFNLSVVSRCIPPQGFIYLRCSPDIAWQRIKKRSRLAEETISFEYIEQIHQQHESFLIDNSIMHESIKHIPILILDGNEEFEDNEIILHKHCAAIEQFIEMTSPHNNTALFQKIYSL